MLSKSFIEEWQKCQKCPLCKLRRSVVIGTGEIPASVLFIGEAPGRQEDILGRPFVGPAGKLLKEQLNQIEIDFSFYITNVVACAPWVDENRKEWRAPSKSEAESCSPRLAGIIKAVNPKTIIYIGQVAKKFCAAPSSIPTLTITHPAAILRRPVPPENTTTYWQTIYRLREHLQDVL